MRDSAQAMNTKHNEKNPQGSNENPMTYLSISIKQELPANHLIT
jgi:hypothetical protein